jgi:hypothetical protein
MRGIYLPEYLLETLKIPNAAPAASHGVVQNNSALRFLHDWNGFDHESV